jgi:hypothetical protein
MPTPKPLIGTNLTVTEHANKHAASLRIINLMGQWIYVENGERFHFSDHRIGPGKWQTSTHRYEL